MTRDRRVRVLEGTAFAVLAFGVVAEIAAVSWPLAEAGGYDRFAYPKELVLVATALPALALVLLGAGPPPDPAGGREGGLPAGPPQGRRDAARYDLWLVGFLVLGALSALVAAPNGWLAQRSLGLSLAGAAAFFTARSLSARGRGRHLEMTVVVAVAATAATVVAEAHGLVDLSMDGRAPGGTLGNRNYAAHILALGIPVLVVAVLTAGRRARIGHALLLAAVLHAIVLTHCRGAWLATLAMAAWAAFALWRRRGGRASSRHRAVALALAAAVGVVSGAALPNALIWRRDSHLLDTLRGMADYRTGTGRGRLIQYESTLAMIGSSWPLGVGPGNWSVRYPEFAGPGDPSLSIAVQPVNRLPTGDWLGIAAERGLPALLALVAFALALARRARARPEGPSDPRDLVVPATLLAAAVMGAFDAVLLRPETALLLAVVLGAFAPTPTATARAAGRDSSRVPVRALAAVSALALAVAFAGARIRDLRSLGARVDGLEAVPPERGVAALAIAAELSPGDYRIRAMLAVTLATVDCESASDQARAALRLYPAHSVARQVLDRCATGARPPPRASTPLAPPGASGQEEMFFGQVQSSLEDLDGQPLIAASWSGEFRPYVYRDGAYRPLVEDPHGRLARVDLYRPMALSSREILMTGQHAGRRAFDLYLHRLGEELPVNLTRTPEIDEGDPCLRPRPRLVAFREADRQVFARVGSGGSLERIASPAVGGFRECAWLDDSRLVGVSGRAAPFRLTDCRVAGAAVDCRERAGALDEVTHVTDLVPGEPGSGVAYLTALAGDRPFRTVFEIRADPDGAPVPVRGPDLEGDLLEWSPAGWRIGHQGRYRSSLAPRSEATIFKVRRIGGRFFAIAADADTPRTLAVLEGEDWSLRPPADQGEPPAMPAEEIWTRSPAGERYQSFYFGPRDASRAVVWLHGGPRESVSPRFNPYFHALDRLGFAVMALNYPGSTGRGAAYESRHADDEALVDALRSVWDHLRARGITTIVAWSVSAGSRLSRVLVERGFPLSAVVDQAGFDNRDLVELAARAQVPVFAIRGRHDRFGPGTRVDYLYEGGHDITHRRDFAGLFAALAPFLSAARPAERVTGDAPASRSDPP